MQHVYLVIYHQYIGIIKYWISNSKYQQDMQLPTTQTQENTASDHYEIWITAKQPFYSHYTRQPVLANTPI